MIPRVSGGAVWVPFAMLPARARSETRLLLAARGLRAAGDGFISLLLPVYLLALGYRPFETGVIATATLAGSALLNLLVGHPPCHPGPLELPRLGVGRCEVVEGLPGVTRVPALLACRDLGSARAGR